MLLQYWYVGRFQTGRVNATIIVQKQLARFERI